MLKRSFFPAAIAALIAWLRIAHTIQKFVLLCPNLIVRDRLEDDFEKGKVFSPDDYGTKFFVAMNGQNEYTAGDKHEACKDVPQTIPRSPGHMQEWFRMMKDGTPSYSNFDIAAYLTEIILLGCVALRVGEGRRMEWDGPNMKSTNLPEAAQFVRRNNRKGWEA